MVIPVANARVAEHVVHHILAKYRIDARHELFDLSGNMHLIEHARNTVQALDAESELPLPQSRPVSMLHWQVANLGCQGLQEIHHL